jgi:DNA-directed RNA polymerase subunit RPC12/RpoP
MTEFKCGNCKEILILSPRARFCPECGSTSLNLIVKELMEPAQKETLGVYSPQTTAGIDVGSIETAEITREEEDQPRRRRR